MLVRRRKSRNVGRLRGKNLSEEVLRDVRVIPGDGDDQVLRVATPLHGQGEQPEAGRPSLGALDERCQSPVGQPHTMAVHNAAVSAEVKARSAARNSASVPARR